MSLPHTCQPDLAASTSEAQTGPDVRQEAIRHPWQILAVLSALMGFASISTDLYLPAMPAMAKSLGASMGMVEFTISSYLVGFAMGQLFWGPISDRHGRRLPLSIGMILFIIGSIGCARSQSIEMIIAWRIVQALGACAGVVLARAMVRDLYSGSEAARMMSMLMTVMAIAPLLGPIVGGQILIFASWRAIFWTLVGVGALTLVAVFKLPETLTLDRRNKEPLFRALGNYLFLIRQRKLIGFAGAGSFFYGGMFAYVAGSPFVYIEIYHIPPQLYGFLFGAGIIGIMVTNVINARLVIKYGIGRLLRWGTFTAALAGLILVMNIRTGWGGVAGLAVPLFFFISMTGLVVANTVAGALADFSHQAGSVSALVGALQYGSGIVGSALVGICADGTAWPLGWVVVSSGIGAAMCAWLVISSKRQDRN